MKTTLAVVVVLLVLCALCVQAGVVYDPQQRDVFGTTRYNVDFSEAQTNKEIVTAVTAATLVIDYIVFSASAACSLYFLEGGAGVFGPIRCIANDTVYLPNCNVRFTSGEGIDVTTSLAGAHTVSIEYHQEP